MRLIKFIFLSLFIVHLWSACKNDNNNDDDNQDLTMDDLIVSQNFDWSTTQDVEIKIFAKDNQGSAMSNVIVEVYTEHPIEAEGLLMIKGATDENGYFEAERPVSAYYTSLVLATKQIGLIDYIEIPIVDGLVQYTFGGVPVKNKNLEWITPKSTNSQIAFLGSYNSQGVPDYLENPGDVITSGLLSDLNNSFPEGQDLSVTHPEYMSTDYDHDVLLECESSVWVTFISEGAGYKNVLGFYKYDRDDPPASVNDIDTITIIFPNTSFAGSGGGLYAGDKVKIGTFPANTGIGWVLIANGWQNGQVTDGYNYYYSNRQFNPESDPSLKQHSVLLIDPGRDLSILAWEDIQRDNQGQDPYWCDQDFNDVMYYVTIDPEPCNISDFPVIDYTGTDTDGDNIPDAFDDYATNAAYAFNNYYPCGVAYGTLAYEDLWPGKGDYDFNDLVTNYRYNQITNGTNKIAKLEATFKVRAIGASYHNGFGLAFNIEPDDITEINGQDLQNGYITNNANGTEANQSKAVVIIFDDAYNILPHPGGGIGVNTEESAPYVQPDSLNLVIELDGEFSQAQLGMPPFNPFIICNMRRGYEVHLPDQPPTDLNDDDLFGTEHDDSNPVTGRYYKTENNLPWAINIWSPFDYPIEKAQIVSAYLRFAEWAESDGVLYSDWYLDNTGYRNDNYIYSAP